MVPSPGYEASPSTSKLPEQNDDLKVTHEPEEALKVDIATPRVIYTPDQQKVLHIPIALLEEELAHQPTRKVLQIPSSLNKGITCSRKRVLHFLGVVKEVQAYKSQPFDSEEREPMAELRSEVPSIQSQMEVMCIASKHLKEFVLETKTYEELISNAPQIETKAPPDWSIYNEQAHQIMRTMNYEPLSNQTLMGEEAATPPFKVIEAMVGFHKTKQGVGYFFFISNYERVKARI
ncbi:hypothetical protein AMTRI_Chr04g246680 [Amborella trichopoda]